MATVARASITRTELITRVLVAEPEVDTRHALVEALRSLGCDTVEASDGRDALVKALIRCPSAIVMDTQLPLIDGPDLCEILRRDSKTRTVPIIAVAVDPSGRYADQIRRAGATLVLPKPVSPDVLLAELKRLASSRRDTSPVQPAPWPTPVATDSPPPPRLPKSKAHLRCATTTPPAAPPLLRCPSCDVLLVYERSYVGGVSQRHSEQWDVYSCAHCGAFEYRHRTRRLRSVS